MNKYIFLENHYSEFIDDAQLSSLLIQELDLSSMGDNFKDVISKLNISGVSGIFEKIENKLKLKLKEFDVDASAIQKSAKKSSKEIYSIINNGYAKKTPSKILAKQIKKSILPTTYEQVQKSAASGLALIGILILAFAVMLFIMTVLLAILNGIFGMNIMIAYIIILLFTFKIFALSTEMVFSLFDGSSDSTVVTYQKKLKSVLITKNETSNEKLYMVQVFVESFKNLLQKIK